MDSEASSSTREDEDARDDDENEDGLALAAANEARMLASKGGGDVSAATRAGRGTRPRRATRALAERVGRSQTMSAGCAVELKNVEGVTNAMMDTVDAGRAMCCALGPNRNSAVGTQGGFIFVERCVKGETTVSCLKSANNFAGIHGHAGRRVCVSTIAVSGSSSVTQRPGSRCGTSNETDDIEISHRRASNAGDHAGDALEASRKRGGGRDLLRGGWSRHSSHVFTFGHVASLSEIDVSWRERSSSPHSLYHESHR